jgi:ABC-type glutathione transport system ATPase component
MDADDIYHDVDDIEDYREEQRKIKKNMVETTEKITKVKEIKPGERTHYGKVAIVGPSGTGKSYIGKTADRDTTGYINVENQPMPYKAKPFKYEGRPKTWASFMKNLRDYAENPEILRIIIDSQSMAFDKLNNEMGKNFSNWDVPKNYNKNVYDYLELMKSIQKDIIILAHDELVKIDDGSKQRRMTVHNKEYEGKIEKHYTIVLFSGTRIEDNKPEYFLKTFEVDTSAKTPEGMFPDKNGVNLLEIPNSAKFIFDALEKYYI